MKRFIQKNKWIFLGVILGGTAGYLYWNFVGCSSGTCPITTKPWNSTIYFSVMGGLLFSSFEMKERKNDNQEESN